MRREHRDLVEDGNAAFGSLFPCHWYADNDVAEEMPCELAELSLLHRECEDVGGAILSAIDLVELMETFVVS